jgi:hypothetical protein
VHHIVAEVHALVGYSIDLIEQFHFELYDFDPSDRQRSLQLFTTYKYFTTRE